MAFRDLASSSRARALSLVRTREPAVLWGNEPMNGGNYLYLWATAWARHRRTDVCWQVRAKPRMAPWLREFPALAQLTVSGADVSWRQKRTVEWGQQAGRDWEFDDLTVFARRFLLSSASFSGRLASVDRDAVVVNVRRGDYYRVPENRRNYGFNIEGYVSAAIARVPLEDQGRIVLVSDDVDWCRRHLGFLHEHGEVSTLPGEHDMFQDFAQLTGARHLILANSTFSFWGAYCAGALPTGQGPRSVQVPAIHNRLYDRERSILLPPEWSALTEAEFDAGEQVG